MQENVWIAEQREAYAKRKQKIPPQEELAKSFAEARAGRVATLGLVEVKLGRTARRRSCWKNPTPSTPTNATVAGALGEMAAKAGNDAKAMEYLIPARLSGHAPDTANRLSKTLYKKSHNGSLDGLEAMLDTEYRKRFPNPIHVEAYKPAEKRSDRMVLAEVFTGSGCPPCAGADMAFDAAMERYARKDLAVVMYHVHVPRPDPMTTVETTRAIQELWRERRADVRHRRQEDDGRRTARLWLPECSSDSRRIWRTIWRRRRKPTAKIDAGLNGGTVKVSAAVDDVKSDSKDLRCRSCWWKRKSATWAKTASASTPWWSAPFGGEKAEGYAIEANGKGTFDASFDLEAMSKAIKKHLDDFEAKGHRGESFKFSAKKVRDQSRRPGCGRLRAGR